MAVGEEADMADAMEPVGHGVQEKAPDELAGGERHHLGRAAVAVVFPGEADLAVAMRMAVPLSSRWVAKLCRNADASPHPRRIQGRAQSQNSRLPRRHQPRPRHP
jgi:hypothetical protein